MVNSFCTYFISKVDTSAKNKRKLAEIKRIKRSLDTKQASDIRRAKDASHKRETRIQLTNEREGQTVLDAKRQREMRSQETSLVTTQRLVRDKIAHKVARDIESESKKRQRQEKDSVAHDVARSLESSLKKRRRLLDDKKSHELSRNLETESEKRE